MSVPKYKQFYQLMIENHGRVFKKFKPIHDAFVADPEKNADEFHTQGRQVLDIVRDWERRLCHGMEKGQYASYSAGLAEKFWDQVRVEFPKIDEVGVKVRKLAKSRLA